MGKNANFVSHKKSKLKENGGPKLPLAADLVEGEIAINFGKDVETLSIKNESGDVVTFSSDNYYTEKKLGSGFTGENSGVTVTEAIQSLDLGNEVEVNSGDTPTGQTIELWIDESFDPAIADVYTKAETDTLLDGKLDVSAYTPSVELWVSGTGVNSAVLKGGNNGASGTCSVAEGAGSKAIGDYSHAEGHGTATGDTSHAEGIGRAFGYYSHAEGNATATGNYSHAEGNNTTASGSYSHAEGQSTANGDYSHTEGDNTTASGYSSHAEGYYSIANGMYSHSEGNNTTASGLSSHAEGFNAKAIGQSSHAEGYGTIASGYSSHAEGSNTKANGDSSHAEGSGSKTIGNFSHAEGLSTVANNRSEHASGQYNVSNSATTEFGDSGNTLFSVGNGIDDDNRHNAFEIMQNGDIYITSGGTDILLQDYLGGNIEIDQVIDSGTSASTNAVSTKAVVDKLIEDEQVWAIALNELNNNKFGYAEFDNNSKSIEFYKDSDEASSGVPISTVDLSSFSIDIDQVIDSGTSASTDAVSTSAVYGFVTSYTPSITVDQDFSNTASTNPISTKAVYSAMTENELVWANAFVALSGTVSAHTANTEIHVTAADKARWDSSSDSLWESGSGISSVVLKGSSGTASGDYAVAEGVQTESSGQASHAEGGNTHANGNGSHAEGGGTLASGVVSHAEGSATIASGDASHSEGITTTANGQASHAEGVRTIASGTSSHSEGQNTNASGNYSHAEGNGTTANGIASHAEGGGSEANGNGSHAEGSGVANGNYSHAEGLETQASDQSSHAEGRETIASGQSSHAEGYYTRANGTYSHTEGMATIANNESEHASGQYNVSNSATTEFGDSGNTLFSVGNGTYDDSTETETRHNAFEIRQNGDIYITSGGTDIKLQDNIGKVDVITAITPSNSGSTDPIATKVVAENELTVSNALNDLNDRKLNINDFNTYSGGVDTAINSKASQSDLTTLSGTVTGHTSNANIHLTTTEKTNIDSITGSVGTMAYEDKASYSSATEVNSAFSNKVNNSTFTAHTASTVHMDNTEKTNLDSLATNIGTISGITSTDKLIHETMNRRTRTNFTSKGLEWFKTTLKSAIADKSLEKYGLKVGDYCSATHDGKTYNYVIAGLNTMKGTHSYRLTTDHVGIIVDTNDTHAWNTSNSTSTSQNTHSTDGTWTTGASAAGYASCDLQYYLETTVLPNVKTDLGSGNIKSHYKLYSTAVNTSGYNRFGSAGGCSSSWAWYANQEICALSEVQVYGSIVWSSSGYDTGEACRQLDVFRVYNMNEIFEGRYPWLRDVASSSIACVVYAAGSADYSYARLTCYVAALILFA